jgi:hypothetical protein
MTVIESEAQGFGSNVKTTFVRVLSLQSHRLLLRFYCLPFRLRALVVTEPIVAKRQNLVWEFRDRLLTCWNRTMKKTVWGQV